jgi:hypothetical protein
MGSAPGTEDLLQVLRICSRYAGILSRYAGILSRDYPKRSEFPPIDTTVIQQI